MSFDSDGTLGHCAALWPTSPQKWHTRGILRLSPLMSSGKGGNSKRGLYRINGHHINRSQDEANVFLISVIWLRICLFCFFGFVLISVGRPESTESRSLGQVGRCACNVKPNLLSETKGVLTAQICIPRHQGRILPCSSCRAHGARVCACRLDRAGRTLCRTRDNPWSLFRDQCGGKGTLCCGKHLVKTEISEHAATNV